MSWDQQAFSFGNPNAQPPTPTQTPTSAEYPSPTFQTPRNITSSIENRSGWTPHFAEEYSVFNATPGRLTSAQTPLIETPRPSTNSSQDQPLSSSGAIGTDFATHVHHISPNLSLPPVDPSNQLSSSPKPNSSTWSRFGEHSKQKVTPQKSKKRIEGAFSGQTATPPQSASKGARKLAPKISTDTMQHDSHDSPFGPSGTPTQHSNPMQFPSSSVDFFGYPMSAPVSAPVFTNTKPFWEPDTGMSGMELDFSVDNTDLFSASSHRLSTSIDWGRSNNTYQETTNLPPTQGDSLPLKRQRPLTSKASVSSVVPPASLTPFNFSSAPVSDDPFAVAAVEDVVDPGLLFTRHTSSASESNLVSAFEDIIVSPNRPVTSHIPRQPYQHQLRELRLDQEELRRSRSTREGNSGLLRLDRGAVSSPVKSSARPGLHRSMSDNRGKRTQLKRQALNPTRQTHAEDRTAPGRLSPIRRQRPTSLISIPESPVARPRTEVKFTIDANGRARTETIIVGTKPKTKKGGPSTHSEEWDQSPYASSTDEEEIILPSQNNSFALPTQRNGPKLARFDTNVGVDGRRSSTSGSGYSQSEGHESEAETVREEDDGSGDATRELRKVLENRKKNNIKSRTPHHHQYSDRNHRGGVQYSNYSSSANISPTTVTDPDAETPSSSRSGSTRCVCNTAHSNGFMIQCESCDNWLHASCVGIDRRSLPPVYICAFCANTPNIRGARKAARSGANLASSPLAHKSFKSFR